MSKIPTGLWKRGTGLAWAATKLASSRLADRVANSGLERQLRATAELVETLAELKGAAMKLGQLASIDLSELLPPEAQQLFGKLHSEARAVPFAELRPLLLEDLGARLADFQGIEEAPLASASIGQVHAAKLGEQDVVLKVQYPHVRESLGTDLRVCRGLLTTLARLYGKDMDLAPLFDEIEATIVRETDYARELAMAQRYRERLLSPRRLIPRVYPEHSGPRVLCAERVEGQPLLSWAAQAFPHERQRIAEELIALFLDEFFGEGLVQTDPNPGNFLVSAEGLLVLLDFGATKEYPREFVEGYRSLVRAARRGDRQAQLDEAVAMGFLDAREDTQTKETFLALIALAALNGSQSAFDFEGAEFTAEASRLSLKLMRELRYTPPPHQLVFLHRKLAGIFALNRKLGAKIDLAEHWERVLNPKPA